GAGAAAGGAGLARRAGAQADQHYLPGLRQAGGPGLPDRARGPRHRLLLQQVPDAVLGRPGEVQGQAAVRAALASRALGRRALLCGPSGPAAAGAPPPLRPLDPQDLDRSADPCQDIWRFANGGWLDRTPVPPDQDSFGIVDEVESRNAVTLRALLEEASAKKAAPRGSRDQLLGDFWCACMDTDAIEKQGLVPISDLLGRINSIEDPGDLLFVLVFAQLQGLPLVFRVEVDQAADDPTQLLPWIWQGGLGLP